MKFLAQSYFPAIISEESETRKHTKHILKMPPTKHWHVINVGKSKVLHGIYHKLIVKTTKGPDWVNVWINSKTEPPPPPPEENRGKKEGMEGVTPPPTHTHTHNKATKLQSQWWHSKNMQYNYSLLCSTGIQGVWNDVNIQLLPVIIMMVWPNQSVHMHNTQSWLTAHLLLCASMLMVFIR